MNRKPTTRKRKNPRPSGRGGSQYRMEYWDLFDADEYDTAPEWDGSTPEQEADALEAWLRSAE